MGYGMPDRRVIEAASAPAAVAAGAVLGGAMAPEDAVIAGVASVGTLVGAHVYDRVERLLTTVQDSRRAAAVATLALAAETVGHELQDLVERAETNPVLRRQVAETWAAAADATYNEKIIALGLALSRAWRQTDEHEQHRLLQQSLVLRVLEELHARVLLDVVEPRSAQGTTGPGISRGMLDQKYRLAVLLDPVLQTLMTHGLVQQQAQKAYVATDWGLEVAGLFKEAAALDQDEVARS